MESPSRLFAPHRRLELPNRLWVAPCVDTRHVAAFSNHGISFIRGRSRNFFVTRTSYVVPRLGLVPLVGPEQ